jgi:hypothetical protein
MEKLRNSRTMPKKFLACGMTLMAFLLVSAASRISLGQTHGQDLTLQIPPVKTSVQIEKQPVAITAWGSVTMVSRTRDLVAFKLQLQADLSDLQQNATGFLAAALDKSDRCGEQIQIQHADLAPADPASVVTAQLHYERFACTKAFGKQVPHRLVGGNAVVEIKLTPVVEESRTVRLQPELGTIQADGSLGELLRSGPIGQMLREKISQAMVNAMQKGTNYNATLPPVAQDYATLESVRFKNTGSGRLAVVLDGEIHLSSDQVQLLKTQLKERVAK